MVTLAEQAETHFEELVVGPAVSTLDDGEAATIAYAVSNGCTAILDERKAVRICSERFPKLPIACTVDIMIHPTVERRLGATGLADALFRALQDARMRVPPGHLELVVAMIGQDRARICPSLPKRVRMASART
jgi:hypothetical protein